MATPPPAGESWYLHSGSARLPNGLQALIKEPDGAPTTRSPNSAAMLGYRGGGGVAWPEHAHNHLLFPRLYALLPPSCKRAVIWNPDTAKLDGVSAPPKCSAASPGYGYMDVPPGTTPEALRPQPGATRSSSCSRMRVILYFIIIRRAKAAQQRAEGTARARGGRCRHRACATQRRDRGSC